MSGHSCQAHFANDVSELAAIRALLHKQLSTAQVAEELIHDVILAVDEACANVMRHAYPPGQREPGLAVELQIEEGRIQVAITDHGASFEPEKVPMPDLARCREIFKTGGYGMYLMRTLVDHVIYDIQPGIKNEVRLIKSLGAPSHAQ